MGFSDSVLYIDDVNIKVLCAVRRGDVNPGSDFYGLCELIQI
jgi:predicted nucleotidyltransferase